MLCRYMAEFNEQRPTTVDSNASSIPDTVFDFPGGIRSCHEFPVKQADEKVSLIIRAGLE